MPTPQGYREPVTLYLFLCGLAASVHGQHENQNSTCCTAEEPGLQSADVAAIALGAILLLLLVITVVVCCKKVCLKEDPDQIRVSPVIMGFSTSPEQLKYQTASAIELERHNGQKRNGDLKQPIIYMYDDIYHPPKSRPVPSDHVIYDGIYHSPKSHPLPSGDVIPNGHPAAPVGVKRSPRSHRRPRHSSGENPGKPPATPRSRSTDHGEGASLGSSKTVSVNGHLIFPDSGRMNFTTHYEVAEPYRY